MTNCSKFRVKKQGRLETLHLAPGFGLTLLTQEEQICSEK